MCRALGVGGVMAALLAPWARAQAADHFAQVLRTIEACTYCGKCETVCPYHLPVVSLLQRVAAGCRTVSEALAQAGWQEQYRGVQPPFAKPAGRVREFMS